jgi:hypothetical protein
MKRKIWVNGMVAALAVAVMTGGATAGVREYCASYARDVAHRKTDGEVSVGTTGGTSSGALLGGRAAIGGTILGAGATGDRYKRAYTNAFEHCVANYEGQRMPDATAENKVADTKVADTKVADTKVAENKVTETKAPAVSKVTKTKVALAVEKVEASGPSWAEACARKYRSWDPQKGKYKSYSGQWRPCRLKSVD